jgi:RAMP superfamily protein
MTAGKLIFDVTIAVRSPYIFAGLKAVGLGIDTSALRNENDAPANGTIPPAIIPGDHLRGHLREAFETLCHDAPGCGINASDIADLFGKASDRVDDKDTDIDLPTPGGMQFSDLVGPAPGQSRRFTRVKIDEKTGAAEVGMLQTVELAAPLNEVSLFSGHLMVFYPESKRKKLEDWLALALGLLTAMGGVKSAGFGEIVHEMSAISFNEGVHAVCKPSEQAPGDRVTFDVAFDRPLLVNSERIAGNVFRGSTIVPGGAFKGALAQVMAIAGLDVRNDSSGMGKALSKVIFSHAFPLVNGNRGAQALPLSLVADVCGKDRIFDVLVGNSAILDRDGKAPITQGDWKDEVTDLARQKVNRPAANLRHIARVRTKIGADGTAEDEMLFSTIAVATGGENWRLTLDRNGADSGDFDVMVQTIIGGLHGVGRTDAFAKFEIVGSEPEINDPAPLTIEKTECWPIMLETPAVMSNPENTANLHSQFEASLQSVLGSGAKLHKYFATTRSAGGYLAMRYRAFGDKKHQPFELTDAGSVFLVSGVTDSKIAELCRTGVPAFLPGSAISLDWKSCPFVAENGYGVVSIDSELHKRLGRKFGHV